MTRLWHPSTQPATRHGASCLIALPAAPQDGGGWFITPMLYNWREDLQCWEAENGSARIEPGGRFCWAYECDLLAELERKGAAEHG